MSVFIINEWIWSDISGANGDQGKGRAVEFLDRFLHSSHQVVIVLGSAFDKKAWELCRSQEAISARIAKLFVVQIRQNESHGLLVDLGTLHPIPDDLVSRVKDDDHYLVRALVTIENVTLVTSDSPLRSVLTEYGMSAISREEFYATYFGIQ